MAPEEKETQLKQIRTFQGDVAEALASQQESLVSIQRAEQKKNPVAPRPQLTPETKRARQYVILSLASLLLFGLGAAGVWFAFGEFERRSVTQVDAVPTNRFISASSVETYDVSSSTRETLLNALASAGAGSTPSEPVHINLEKKEGLSTILLPSDEFLNILQSRAPGTLIRSFEEPFMLGSLGQSRFIIFRLASYDHAFAGMLAWERYMAEDIGSLFATAPLLRDIIQTPTFADLTDRNKDIRILRTESGQTMLLYSFFENGSLVITDDLESMRTLLDRLARERLSR